MSGAEHFSPCFTDQETWILVSVGARLHREDGAPRLMRPPICPQVEEGAATSRRSLRGPRTSWTNIREPERRAGEAGADREESLRRTCPVTGAPAAGPGRAGPGRAEARGAGRAGSARGRGGGRGEGGASRRFLQVVRKGHFPAAAASGADVRPSPAVLTSAASG